MTDTDCITFLQDMLPRLGLRWPGFRKVRRQVCKRLQRRLRALNLPDLNAYHRYLDTHTAEWAVLDSLCRISISRFYRDRVVFDRLRDEVLPALAREALIRAETTLHCWSIGCASGEEPYTLQLVWQLVVQPHFPGLTCHILATDADPQLLTRAAAGCYPASSLRELPEGWRTTAFTPRDNDYCLHRQFRQGVAFQPQDIRTAATGDTFDLILCRNLVFTYFDEPGQQQALACILERLRPGGVLVIGKSEQLPAESRELTPWGAHLRLYRRR
jgi:chemotaxis protein methyltransferase CheR